MSQLEPYLYHLIPVKNGVNALPLMPLLFPDGMSERTLLLSIWAVLRVRSFFHIKQQLPLSAQILVVHRHEGSSYEVYCHLRKDFKSLWQI